MNHYFGVKPFCKPEIPTPQGSPRQRRIPGKLMRDTVPDKLYQVVGTTGPEQIELRMQDNGEKAETGVTVAGLCFQDTSGAGQPASHSVQILPFALRYEVIVQNKKGDERVGSCLARMVLVPSRDIPSIIPLIMEEFRRHLR